jgi:hypothetical protein
MDVTGVDGCTSDGFTKSVGALVYFIDREGEECKVAYPSPLFDRIVVDGRGMGSPC